MSRGKAAALAGFGLALLGWWLIPRPDLSVPHSSLVQDESGELVELTLTRDGKYRLPIGVIPSELRTALLRYEDQRFTAHDGVDPFSMARSVTGWLLRRTTSGGSTITMQVARLRYGLRTRTVAGKLCQMMRAVQIERHYSKDEILRCYFDLAPYGFNVEGARAASLIYFHKDPAQLTHQEILALAVLPQSPTRRAPRGGIEPSSLTMARKRLDRMTWNDPLADLPLRYGTLKELPHLAPHAVRAVLHGRQAEVKLTLRAGWQRMVGEEVQRYLQPRAALGIDNAACLLVDANDSSIRSYVGSGGFYQSRILGQNDGTLQFRSPGSSLKPFVYALALDGGFIHPSSLLYDTPARFGDYVPENIDGKYDGPIPARLALVRSRNLPAVALAARLGSGALVRFLHDAEVKSIRAQDDYGLSAVLGTVDLNMQELARLYVMLVNGGKSTLLRHRTDDPISPGRQLISPEAAFLTLDMLQTAEAAIQVSSYPRENLPYKTGTSTGFRDAWCSGVIGRHVLVVWVGRFDGKSNPAFTGRTAAVPLFRRIAERLTAGRQIAVSHREPDPRLNLRRIEVCAVSGCLPAAGCPHTRSEWLIPGVSPIDHCPIHDRDGVEHWDSESENYFRISREVRAVHATTSAAGGLRILALPGSVSWRAADPADRRVLQLRAADTGSSERVFWFANQTFLGSSERGQAFAWSPAPGRYTIAVTNETGRAATCKLNVEVDRR